MFHPAMDRTIPRFIPPLPDAGDQIQNKYKEFSDRHPAAAQSHPPGGGLAKGDATSRPCAVIGPDGILPQYRKLDGYPSPSWPQTRNGSAVSYYRSGPSQYYGEQMYPPRNISPRHTFQENMNRFVVPSPAEVKVRNDGYIASNHQSSNFSVASGAKRNISPSVKFCEGAVLVPHSVEVLRSQYHKAELPAARMDVQGQPLTQLTTHGLPVTNVHEIPYMHTNNLYTYNNDYQRYPLEYQNHGIHVVKNNPTYQSYPEQQSPYYIANDYSINPYARVNGGRYESYPPVKDKYVHTRYDYSYQIPNEYAAVHGPPQKLHEPRKKLPPPPADMRYYPLPQKYAESHSHIADPDYRAKISNRRNPNGVPYVTDVPNYPADRYANQAKIFEFNIYDKNSQISGDPRPVTESTKIKIDYYNHCKSLPYPDMHYSNDNSHNVSDSKGGMPVYNYPMRPPEVYLPYFNGNYQKPAETHNIDSDMNHQKPYYNPLAKIPTEFSPNIISPTESNASFDSLNTVSHQQYQEDGGYVSQCSTASGQSNDYQPNGNVKSYERIYNTMSIRPANPYTGFIPQNTSIGVKQAKSQNANKCSIDLRQFVEMWDEEFEDSAQQKTSPETFTLKNVNMNIPQLETNCISASEELYVLDKVTISKDDLHKYEHIQKVTKLPDNIKDYEQIENAKRNKFTKDMTYSTALVHPINKSDSYCNSQPNNAAAMKNKGPRVDIVKSHISVNEPIDVEAKITQSIIHKEVGCNFEIKPCSPGKQVQMSSVNVLVEQKIDKGNKDCLLNDDVNKSHPELIIRAIDKRDKNTPNMEIIHDVKFFEEVKKSTITVKDSDAKGHSIQLQSAGSSLPQIVSDDVHTANTPSNLTTNTGFDTYQLGNNQNWTKSSKILEKCKESKLKIESSGVVKENDMPVRIEPNMVLKESQIENNIVKVGTKTKLQHFNQKSESKLSFDQSYTFAVSNGSNSGFCNPSVIKSNYGRKTFSPIDRVEIESNKISVLTSTEKSLDLSGKAAKDNDYSLKEEKSNEIAQLHTPDICEIIADTNHIDKVAISAVTLSNTNSSKVIHTTLDRVIEAIESNIQHDLDIPKTTHSEIDEAVSYSDLAMDYTSASLDQELRCSLKDVSSTLSGDMHSKIAETETNNSLVAKEKSVTFMPHLNTFPLIEPFSEINNTEKRESLLIGTESMKSSVGAVDKILVHSDSCNISEKSKISPQLPGSDIVFTEIHQEPSISMLPPKDDPVQFQMPSGKSSDSLITTLHVDGLPYSESSSINISQELIKTEHLDSKTDVSDESPLVAFDKDASLDSKATTIEAMDDSPLVAFDKDASLDSKATTIEAMDDSIILSATNDKISDFGLNQPRNLDSMKTDALSQIEVTDIAGWPENTGRAEVFRDDTTLEILQVRKENALASDDNIEKLGDRQFLQKKPALLSEDSSPVSMTLHEGRNEFDMTSNDSSQSVTDVSESTSINGTEVEVPSEQNISRSVLNHTDCLDNVKIDSLKANTDENVTSNFLNGSSVCKFIGKASLDTNVTDSTSLEKATGIPYSPSETWNINHSICDLKSCLNGDESKCPEMNESVTFEGVKRLDVNTSNDSKELQSGIGAVDSLTANDNCDMPFDCNGQVVTDVLICSNPYSKSEGSSDDILSASTAFAEVKCDSYNCEETIYVGIQHQHSPKRADEDVLLNENGFDDTLECIEPDLYNEDVEMSSSQDTNDRTLNGSSHNYLLFKTSEDGISHAEISSHEVEISKIEHDGLELGGCWIDDIACVETVVSEEINLPHEIEETTLDSAQSWGVNSSDDDDSMSHMLHYHVDSVGNILKDTNGNVILTNPLLEKSKGHKKRITNDKSNRNIKRWVSENIQKYTKSEILGLPKIDLSPPSKDLNVNSFKDIVISERQKIKISDSNVQHREEDISHKSKRRKRKRDSETNEIQHRLVRKIDSDEKEYNTCDKKVDSFQSIQLNHPERKILTKGAQKYIPPLAAGELKVHLPLPEKKLLSLSKLNSHSFKSESSESAKIAKEDFHNIKRMVLPKKKSKPKFEDVLKNIEISTISLSKQRTMKFRQTIPKMVIKKNKHGSHYMSVNTDKTNSPDMTGSKWQPFVSISRNTRIENMLKNKQSPTIQCDVVYSSSEMDPPASCSAANKQRSTRDQNKSVSPCFKDSVI